MTSISAPIRRSSLLDGLRSQGVWFGARLALCSAFLASGVLKLADFGEAVAEVRTLISLEPAPLVAALVVAVQLGGSALMLVGGRVLWLGALLLAGFTALATVLGHPFWTRSGTAWTRDLTTSLEHLGLIGGFLLASMIVAHRDADR